MVHQNLTINIKLVKKTCDMATCFLVPFERFFLTYEHHMNFVVVFVVLISFLL